jgi:light-regulated signal transduction histidine kinase (bacteriophytochrome)
MYKTAATIISKNHFKNAFSAIDLPSVILEASNNDFTAIGANAAYLKITKLSELTIAAKIFIDLIEAITVFNTKYNAVLDYKVKKCIAFVVNGAKRMRIIILDLLEFSRVGRTKTSLEAVDIMALISRIEALLLKEIEEKQAKLLYSNLPVITSYAVPLHQVFQNLIGNALKYCHPTKAPIVSVSGKDIGQYWQFEITDNGILKQNIMRKYLIFFSAYIIKKNTQVQALG